MICTAKKALIILFIGLLVGLPAPVVVPAARNSETPEISTELLTSKLRKRSPAFAISVESVLRKLTERQEIILVDVRKRNEFEKFRIPGSINIPLFAVKTKDFLKSKSLVLVNEGYHYRDLEQQCEDLRMSGFRVWILNGGLHAWRQKEAPLKGDAFAQKELNRIPPGIFFSERDYENWLVIDVGPTKNSEGSLVIPRSISIPYLHDNQKFISTLEGIVAKYKDDPLMSVLIFDQRGEQYEGIEKVLQKTDVKNVFFLKGGIAAYKQFLEDQAMIRQAKDDSKNRVKECAGCP